MRLHFERRNTSPKIRVVGNLGLMKTSVFINIVIYIIIGIVFGSYMVEFNRLFKTRNSFQNTREIIISTSLANIIFE